MQKTTRRHYFEDGYALIIGISHYRNAPRLSETILKDALKLHDILRDPKICSYRDSQVRLLTDGDASAKAIRKELYWLAQHASPNATVFIYFSGHGWKVEEQSQEYYYLLAHDSDPEDLKATAIAGGELTTLLNKIQMQRLFFCIDSCYAGAIGEVKGGVPVVKARALDENDYKQLAQGTGRVIMASSRHDEPSLAFRSMNNSLFTYYLIEALQGKAHIREDQLIHVLDIFHYVSESTIGQNQHPILKVGLETNFPIALAPVQSPAPANKATYQIHPDKGSQANMDKVDTRTLYEAMLSAFNRDDLHLLCADIQQDLANDGISLRISLADVGKDGPVPNQILDLIQYLERRGHLPYLVKAIRRVRPNLL